MNGEKRQRIPEQINITTGQLETFVHVVEALANRRFIQKNLPNIGVIEPSLHPLFISDLIIKAETPDMFVVVSGKAGGFEVAAGEYFTVLNETEAKVRLSFFDDTTYSTFASTAKQLQLPNEGGIPVLVLEPKMEGAVTTFAITGGGLAKVWINIEKRDGATWKAVGPGGNGANMRINNP